MQVDRIWTETNAEGAGNEPVLAFAIHQGHQLRDDVATLIALDEADRLREEDPFTSEWTKVAGTQVIGLMSRFQVDLNRPRDQAVYRAPEDAWGLNVWKWGQPPPWAMVAESLREYDDFYASMGGLLRAFERRFGRFIVLDLHSYNHRRGGPDAPSANEATDPQVNVGTSNMNRQYWAPVVDGFIRDLREHDFPGGRLHVEENVKFQGGHFARWVHKNFPRTGCCLSVEFKKFFMDEWTGEPDRKSVTAIGEALQATIPTLVEAVNSQ